MNCRIAAVSPALSGCTTQTNVNEARRCTRVARAPLPRFRFGFVGLSTSFPFFLRIRFYVVQYVEFLTYALVLIFQNVKKLVTIHTGRDTFENKNLDNISPMRTSRI